MSSTPARLLVVSHPAVLAVNQLPYAEIRRHGWEPLLVTPASWRHEYANGSFAPEVLPELSRSVTARRVILPGRVQRHAYLARISRLIAQLRPRAAFVEQEPTSVAGFQWARALCLARVPFGLQVAENLDRPWPLPARMFRRFTLDHAAFVAARSPTAAERIRAIRSDLPAPVIPHHVPGWGPVDRPERDSFVIGYAGRLVPEKGLDVLIDAVAGMEDTVLRFVGNGPLHDELKRRAVGAGVQLEIDTTVPHEAMAAAYSSFDVLVLPSRTTTTWVEQFGRVLVEALWCGVPVVGSDSGEIPWVIDTTGGGLVFPEDDVGALRDALIRLRESPSLRHELAVQGRVQAHRMFSVEAVAAQLNLALRAAMTNQPRPSRTSADLAR